MDTFLNKDLYEILHINKDATNDEIKIAYRRLARIYHPDINESPQSIAIFKDIRAAYDILSNAEKRKLYDLKNGYNQKSAPKKEDTSPKEAPIKEEQKEPKEKSIAQKLTDILDGIFVYSKRNSEKKVNKSQKGDDIYANVTISAKEAALGTNRIVNVVQTQACSNCSGKKFINEAVCPLCKGTGEISTHKRINVKIPSGIKNNEKIKIANSGNQGTDGVSNGDLYLIVNIDEKSLFTVKDDVVYMDLPISVFEAALGASIKIPTFYEDIVIKIPPNTSSGQKFRLKGQGIYLKEKGVNGDMIVTAYIKLPKSFSNAEKSLFKELEKLNTYDVREGLKDNE